MSKKILVVDDNPDILELVKILLERKDYEVETLINGRETLDFVDAIHPNLIILDVMLGNCDGRDICRNLKSRMESKNIPIIMFSGSHNIRDSIGTNCFPDDFLEKPFDIDALLEKVGRLAA